MHAGIYTQQLLFTFLAVIASFRNNVETHLRLLHTIVSLILTSHLQKLGEGHVNPFRIVVDCRMGLCEAWRIAQQEADDDR